MSEATVALAETRKSAIRWKRVILAGFLSEIIVIAVIAAIYGTYTMVIAPGQPNAAYHEFAQNAGYFAAAPAAFLGSFLMAYWAVRKLESAIIANGVLVGIVGVLLSAGFIVGARPEDRMMYLASFVLRIAGGYTAGKVVLSMKERRR